MNTEPGPAARTAGLLAPVMRELLKEAR